MLIATTHRSPTFDGNINGAGSLPLATPYQGTLAEHVGLRWMPIRSPVLMYSIAPVPFSCSAESAQSKNSILVRASLISMPDISFREKITGRRYFDSTWTGLLPFIRSANRRLSQPAISDSSDDFR